MFRTGTVAGTLLLGVGVVAAAEDHVTLTQLAMKSNLKNAVVLYDITKGKAAYDQNAVDTALVGLEDVAKRFPSFFPKASRARSRRATTTRQ